MISPAPDPVGGVVAPSGPASRNPPVLGAAQDALAPAPGESPLFEKPLRLPGPPGDDTPADGVYPNTPEAVYRAWPCVNQSLLARCHPTKNRGGSPAHMLHYLRQPSEPTDAMERGTALHAALLEPDTLADRVVILKEVRGRRSNDDKAWWASFEAENEGKVILTVEEWAGVLGMVRRLRSHPKLRRVLRTKGENEAAVVWTDPETGFKCKARIDRFVPGVALVDIKTTRNASPEAFLSSVQSYGYDIQGAFYEWGYGLLVEPTPMMFCLAESDAPFEVAVHTLDEDWLSVGRMKAQTALRRYARAVTSGVFEGYGSGILTAMCPKWQKDAWIGGNWN